MSGDGGYSQSRETLWTSDGEELVLLGDPSPGHVAAHETGKKKMLFLMSLLHLPHRRFLLHAENGRKFCKIYVAEHEF